MVDQINGKMIDDLGGGGAAGGIGGGEVGADDLCGGDFEAEEAEVVLVVLFEGEAVGKGQGGGGVLAIDF